MSDRKTIAVVGATGAQGGGLVRAILADRSGEFKARALTRNPKSDKAKALADALFTKAGVPTTFLLTSFYWENLIYFGAGPKRGPDGKLALLSPWATRSCPVSPRRTSASAR